MRLCRREPIAPLQYPPLPDETRAPPSYSFRCTRIKSRPCDVLQHLLKFRGAQLPCPCGCLQNEPVSFGLIGTGNPAHQDDLRPLRLAVLACPSTFVSSNPSPHEEAAARLVLRVEHEQ